MTGIHVVHIPDVMNREPLCLGPQHTVSDSRRFLRENKVRHIPVVDDPPLGDKPGGAGKKLIGILSERDVLRASPPEARLGRRPDLDAMALLRSLSQVMTPNPITVEETTPLAAAAEIMLARKFDAVPVVASGSDHRLVGMLTTSDLLRLLPGVWAIHCRGFASDLMKSRLHFLKPTDELRTAMAVMQSHHIRHLPVSDDGKHLQGMVTDRDILRNLPPLLDGIANTPDALGRPFRQNLFRCDMGER